MVLRVYLIVVIIKKVVFFLHIRKWSGKRSVHVPALEEECTKSWPA
jgi:hypothetical protein